MSFKFAAGHPKFGTKHSMRLGGLAGGARVGFAGMPAAFSAPKDSSFRPRPTQNRKITDKKTPWSSAHPRRAQVWVDAACVTSGVFDYMAVARRRKRGPAAAGGPPAHQAGGAAEVELLVEARHLPQVWRGCGWVWKGVEGCGGWGPAETELNVDARHLRQVWRGWVGCGEGVRRVVVEEVRAKGGGAPRGRPAPVAGVEGVEGV